MTIRRVSYDIDPVAAYPRTIAAGGVLDIDLDEVAISSIKEIIQSRLNAVNISGLLDDLMSPARPGERAPLPLRWMRSGPGVGTEMKRAFSSIFGRFFARWYLEKHHGFTYFKAIDGAPFRVSDRLVINRTGQCFLPDWLCAKAGNVCFGESKGSHAQQRMSNAGSSPPLQKAYLQLQNVQFWVKNNTTQLYAMRAVKGWGVMSRWSTEYANVPALLYAIDPESHGEPLSNDEVLSIVPDIEKAHYASLLEGMGNINLASKILSWSASDDAFRDQFGIDTALHHELPEGPPMELIRIKIEKGDERVFLATSINARGERLGSKISEIFNARSSIPESILRDIYIVGIEQSKINEILNNDSKIGEGKEEVLERKSIQSSSIPIVGVQRDGFIFSPMSEVIDVKKADLIL